MKAIPVLHTHTLLHQGVGQSATQTQAWCFLSRLLSRTPDCHPMAFINHASVSRTLLPGPLRTPVHMINAPTVLFCHILICRREQGADC